MNQEDAILNKLLNRYESAQLRGAENERAIWESLSKKNFPVYHDLKKPHYRDINERLENLEKDGAIEIDWQNKVKGHIIKRIRLVSAPKLYKYLKRVPASVKYGELSSLIKTLREEYGKSNLVERYLTEIESKLNEGKSVKRYVDFDDLDAFSKFVKLLYSVEKNESLCFIREFSVKNFSDSKYLDRNLKKLAATINALEPDEIEKDSYETLADYLIYPNPTYIYLKGNAVLKLEGSRIDLSKLKYGIALAEEDIEKLEFSQLDVERVVTIENLTSFYRFQEPESLSIYIGGFHSRIHDQFLHKLYDKYQHLEYRHFGDIDVGGFYIFFDLIKKTGIPFRALNMNVDTLERYQKYGNDLTQNDKRRLKNLIETLKSKENWDYLESEERERALETLKGIEELGKKLEQEALFWKD